MQFALPLHGLKRFVAAVANPVVQLRSHTLQTAFLQFASLQAEALGKFVS